MELKKYIGHERASYKAVRRENLWVFFSGHPSYISNVSKHQTIYLKYILKSKSGMNDHPTRPFDTNICGVKFWASQLCFYGLKTPNYTPQKEVKK